MQAMILAAGFGTRLLPHTKVVPKPLFPLLNRPLLLLTVERLKNHGFDHILVNCHHLREQISEGLKDVAGVTVIEEEQILGTGGGLRNALPQMRDEPILITNGDIYHTIDFRKMYDDHCSAGRQVSLALHDFPRFNTVGVSGSRVGDFGNGFDDVLAFTGIHVINPSILTDIEEGESCIIDHYRSLLKNGVELSVVRVDESYWTDMGTVEDYLDLHGGLLTGKVPCWKEISFGDNPCAIADKAELSGKTEIYDWCAVGAVKGKDVTIARSVIWDGITLTEGGCYEDQLITPAAPPSKDTQTG